MIHIWVSKLERHCSDKGVLFVRRQAITWINADILSIEPLGINMSEGWIKIQLDMSTARRRLKSPLSLSGTSTHPAIVTHRLRSWSWMIDSHPFRSTLISVPIPQIRLFQTVTLKQQGQGHGCGQRARPCSQPYIWLICFLLASHNQIAIPENSVSNRCTSFSFHIDRTNHSWDVQ